MAEDARDDRTGVMIIHYIASCIASPIPGRSAVGCVPGVDVTVVATCLHLHSITQSFWYRVYIGIDRSPRRRWLEVRVEKKI